MNIFYGAGKFAEQNMNLWKNGGGGVTPVRFVDMQKHGQKLNGVPILTFEEAINKYPNSDIYITVGVDLLGKVTDYLLNEKKVPKELIKYPYPVEKRLGCKFIGTRIQFFGENFKTCCTNFSDPIQFNKDFSTNLIAYENYNKDLINKLRKGEKTACDSCPQLRYDIWPVEPILETIGFDSAFEEDRCNFKCIYCDAKEHINKKQFKINLIDIIEKFEEYSKGKYKNIVLASGEISISPYRDTVLEIIKRNNWDVHIFTNASVFVTVIEELLKNGNLKIQVSMDCGTQKTFAEIKGVDLWEKVVENLRKYAQAAKFKNQIELKYILMPGINDNNYDIEGFVKLADELNAHVYISSDMRYNIEPLPEKTYEAALNLTKKCYEKNVPLTFVAEFFNPLSYSRLTEELKSS